MAMMSDEEYGEVMEALGKFSESVNESCSNMNAYGVACSDNMNADDFSQKYVSQVIECIKQYQEVTEKAENLRKGLQQELDLIVEARNKAMQS
jgi:hypothetical protein